jgi:hypothetical protein
MPQRVRELTANQSKIEQIVSLGRANIEVSRPADLRASSQGSADVSQCFRMQSKGSAPTACQVLLWLFSCLFDQSSIDELVQHARNQRLIWQPILDCLPLQLDEIVL